MQGRCTGLFSRLFVSLSFMFLVVACSGAGGGFPQIADPPPFEYVDGEELRSGMHQLAFELQQLDLALATEHALATGYDPSPNLQQRVVSSLQDIERIGTDLLMGDISSSHTFLKDDMTRFLSGVSRAVFEAERNPPRYYSAGRVSGACVNCHGVVR